MKRRLRDRLTIDSEIHHGDPCIKGNRIPAGLIISSLADGMTFDEIQEAYLQLTHDDIYAALAYAAEVLRREIVYPFIA